MSTKSELATGTYGFIYSRFNSIAKQRTTPQDNPSEPHPRKVPNPGEPPRVRICWFYPERLNREGSTRYGSGLHARRRRASGVWSCQTMTDENNSENRGKVTGVKLGRIRERLEDVVEESDEYETLSDAIREFVRRGVLREEIRTRAEESGIDLPDGPVRPEETEEGRELITDGGIDATTVDLVEINAVGEALVSVEHEGVRVVGVVPVDLDDEHVEHALGEVGSAVEDYVRARGGEL